MEKIRIGIVGYGNLGKGLVLNLKDNPDMELVGVFTRRDPKDLKIENAYSYDSIMDFKGKIDILILAGSSKNDILNQSYDLGKNFNTLDAFDTHSLIKDYYKKLNKINLENDTTSLISTGWDPGLFSLNRVISEAILPQGTTYTFWGKGVSQGHSEAIRSIEGVKKAIQYTIPIEENIEKIRNGQVPDLKTRDKHKRLCYVVVEEGFNREKIQDEIVNMENYFKGYDTEVNFITEEEFDENHTSMGHGGLVIRNGKTSKANREIYEFKLNLDSNPEFTSAVMLAYSRALYRIHKEGQRGCLTILDIKPRYLINKSEDEILGMI